jgi:YEATS domain-containing protein 4
MQKKTDEITVPFVYGSIAFPLSKKMEDYTHKWICYLRGIDGENLSYLISKVIFHLHPSCGNPVREINSFPFEIQQMGWGEFEIQLDVYLTLPEYPVVNLVHQLKVLNN